MVIGSTQIAESPQLQVLSSLLQAESGSNSLSVTGVGLCVI